MSVLPPSPRRPSAPCSSCPRKLSTLPAPQHKYELRRAARIVTHPGYVQLPEDQPTSPNDLALILLDRPASEEFPLVHLANGGNTGWGCGAEAMALRDGRACSSACWHCHRPTAVRICPMVTLLLPAPQSPHHTLLRTPPCMPWAGAQPTQTTASRHTACRSAGRGMGFIGGQIWVQAVVQKTPVLKTSALSPSPPCWGIQETSATLKQASPTLRARPPHNPAGSGAARCGPGQMPGAVELCWGCALAAWGGPPVRGCVLLGLLESALVGSMPARTKPWAPVER